MPVCKERVRAYVRIRSSFILHRPIINPCTDDACNSTWQCFDNVRREFSDLEDP